jgi:hypothetical protein
MQGFYASRFKIQLSNARGKVGSGIFNREGEESGGEEDRKTINLKF